MLLTPSACPCTHTNTCRLLGTSYPAAGRSGISQLSLTPMSIPTPLTLQKISFLRLLPQPAPVLSCLHNRWCDTARAAHPCLAQARQCVCIPDWHLQAQGKSSLFVCSHPWLLLSCLYYFMLSEIIILALLDWGCGVCRFFLCS